MFFLRFVDFACTLGKESAHASCGHLFDCISMASAVIHLLNLFASFFLLFFGASDFQDFLAAPTAGFCHLCTTGATHAFKSFHCPIICLVLRQLHNVRNDASLLHALLQDTLPFCNGSLLADQKYPFGLFGHREPRCVTKSCKPGGLKIFTAPPGLGRLGARAVVQPCQDLRISFHKANRKILEESIDEVLGLVSIGLFTSDLDRGRRLVIISLVRKVHLDGSARIRLDLLHIAASFSNQGPCSVLVDSHRGRGCSLWRRRGVVRQQPLNFLETSGNRLGRSIKSHLASLAVNENALVFLLELPGICLFPLHRS
mmetsp:Transcript_17739/g.34154  ORF Transcript_17739/g.34154 Transcript_17739/m.34154 type:complete len:314 (+) Transcript_17739:906-1847(+)